MQITIPKTMKEGQLKTVLGDMPPKFENTLFIIAGVGVFSYASSQGAAEIVSSGVNIQGILTSLYQFFPGIVVVAIIGLLGTLFKSRVDRGINREQGNVKIFESIIKDNDAMRTKNDKLTADLNIKFSECSQLINQNAMLSDQLAGTKELAERVKEEGRIARQIIADKEKEIERLRNIRIQDKIKDIGLSREELAHQLAELLKGD